MVNEKKVKQITSLAIYESGEGKKALKVSQFYRGDYVSMHMLKTWILSTVAFVLMFFLYFAYSADEIMKKIVSDGFVKVAVTVLVQYAIFCAIFVVIAYFVYNIRYSKSKKSVHEYYSGLKELNNLYKNEE